MNLAPKVIIKLNTDSTALRYFYTQSLVAPGLLRINKISGSENVADLGTKYLDRVTLSRLRELAGVRPGVQEL